jgi:restriction system protein
VPTYNEVMLPLLKVAADKPLNRAEATERVSDEMALTSEQRAIPMPRGHSVIRDRVGWARTYLVQAGLLKSVRRGVFEITDAGKSLLAESPSRITIEILMRYPGFVAFRKRSSLEKSGGQPSTPDVALTVPEAAAATPEDRIDAALKELEIALAENLLERIRSGTPAFFERLVLELLTRMGYGGFRPEAAEHIGGPGDGGLDGKIQLDPLGLDFVYVQAKRYAEENVVGRPAVQSFAGALDAHKGTRGVFITTSSYSNEALTYAKNIHNKQIALIDGEQLAELLIAHSVAVREDRNVVIKRLDEDFFEE